MIAHKLGLGVSGNPISKDNKVERQISSLLYIPAGAGSVVLAFSRTGICF